MIPRTFLCPSLCFISSKANLRSSTLRQVFMCVCLCVCVCVSVVSLSSVCVCRASVCVLCCACVFVMCFELAAVSVSLFSKIALQPHTRPAALAHSPLLLQISEVCVCVCVCESKRRRGSQCSQTLTKLLWNLACVDSLSFGRQRRVV